MSAPRVLVVGTGGVGGYYGGTLQHGGCDVVFVARGANLAALRRDGLRVTGARGDFALETVAATDDPSVAGDRDLVLLCVKSYDLEDAAHLAAPCGGIALTLQNGVDAAQRAGAILGDRVLAGSTGIVADLAAPGHVHVVSSYARITFGEPGGGHSERVDRVAEWLSRGSIEVDPRDDVAVALWEKMALICAMAGLTTLYRSPIGPILAEPAGSATFHRIVDECSAVAAACGVRLADDFVAARERYAQAIDPSATSSMLRDLQRGRRVEIEHLNGTVVALARRHGVPVPLNEAVLAGIRIAAASR